jgi:hypothetical protein
LERLGIDVLDDFVQLRAQEGKTKNLFFQEQIALLAHKLGKDLDLDEGNKLRKLLTKKGKPIDV